MIYIFSIVDKANVPNAKGLIDSLNKFKNETCNFTFELVEKYDKTIGNVSKIIKMNEYLKTKNFKDDDIIVLVDSLDIVFSKDPSQLEQEFRNDGLDIIIGAEVKPWHHRKDVIKFFTEHFKNSNLKYLNSGFIIGYGKKIINMFDTIQKNFVEYNVENNYRSDQRLVAYYFMKHFKEVKIDLDINSKYVFNYTSEYRNYDEYKKYSPYAFHVTSVRINRAAQVKKFNDVKKYIGI